MVTFLGPLMYRRRMDISGNWIRGEPVEVSQGWVDKYRHILTPDTFRVEGDAGVTVDAGNDGIPDSGWTKKDIGAWLKEKGAVVGGYNTKSKLLDMVKTTLNPPAPEPEPVVEEIVVAEPVVEEVIEETIIDDPVAEPTGVE